MPFHPPRASGRPGHQWPLPRLGTPIKDPTLQARRTESLVLMPSPSWKGRKGTPPLQLQAGRVQRAPLRAALTHSAPIPEHHHTSTEGSPQQSHRSLRGRAPRKARRTTCPVTDTPKATQRLTLNDLGPSTHRLPGQRPSEDNPQPGCQQASNTRPDVPNP